jgi:hypothetical protein
LKNKNFNIDLFSLRCYNIISVTKEIAMKLQEFKYIKQNGQQSQRAVVVVQEPQHLVAGIDVSHLDEGDFAHFIDEYRQTKNRQHEELLQLMAKHDLKHNFRQFKPENMTNVETTWV